MSLHYTYSATNHSHTCPECDDRYPCDVSAAQCAEPDTCTCSECAEPIGHAVDCDACHLYGEPHLDPETAYQRAATHDDNHHYGTPTATVRST